MSEQGWIKLHRQLLQHPFWTQKRKFSKAEAWIDLLLRANHAEVKKMDSNGQIIVIERGQILTSELELSERWGWDRKTVRRWLTLVQDVSQMLTKKSTTKYTILTIVNYDFYQGDGTTDSSPLSTTEGTTDAHQIPHKQECKNVKNVRNIYTVEFEKFWSIYPRTQHQSKSDAFKCWNARLKEGHTPDEIIKGTIGYASWCRRRKTEEQYIKQPKTFLGPGLHFMSFQAEAETIDPTQATLARYERM